MSEVNTSLFPSNLPPNVVGVSSEVLCRHSTVGYRACRFRPSVRRTRPLIDLLHIKSVSIVNLSLPIYDPLLTNTT